MTHAFRDSLRLLSLALLASAPLLSAQGTPAPSAVMLPPTGYGSTNSYFGSAAALYADWALIGSLAKGGGDPRYVVWYLSALGVVALICAAKMHGESRFAGLALMRSSLER